MKYKEKLEGFPEEVVEKMLERQVEQGNKRDVSVFECYKSASINSGGFYWSESEEGNSFWEEVISNKNFDIFFKRYPKKEETYMKYMMVSDEPITKKNKGKKQFVIGKINNEYCAFENEACYDRRHLYKCSLYKYAKNIETTLRLTLREVAEMAKVDNVEIVEK